MSGIRLSEKHGVNPSLGVCWWCGKDDGTVLLLGRLKGDEEAPRKACVTTEPCEECKAKHALGIVMVESDDGKFPVQPARWCVVSEEFVKREIKVEELKQSILKKRMFLAETRLVDALLGQVKKEG